MRAGAGRITLPRTMRAALRSGLAALSCLVAFSGGAFAQVPRRGPPVVAPPEGADGAFALSAGVSAVAERTLPAVVALYVEIVSQGENLLSPLPGFWGAPVDEPQRRTGSGSGVLIREDGVIVTNRHVVNGATRIRVRLHDGRIVPGRVLGADPATDLAVLKIDGRGYPTARLGDSEAARVGEYVLALGAPFGLEHTVTLGVISATGRGGLGVNAIEDYLQTDASINPGNSGGALVNLRGEVLGINTLVVGRGQGIGFAIPSRIAQWAAEQIVRTGRVTRGWIGLNAQNISPDLEDTFGAIATGAIVNQLDPRGPAAAAGVRLGDVIVEVDGQPVRNRHEVMRRVALRGVGERLALTLRRGARRERVEFATTLRPGESPAPPGPPPAPPPEPGPTGFGMGIDAVPPFLAERYGLEAGTGVVIVEVQRGGAADRAGLRPGDVIVQADGQPVRNIESVIEAARDGRAVLLVRRGTAQEFIGLRIERPG